jgi:acyl-CoA synthetase (AMP-forming)/AMP-acid ligase II
LPFYFIDNLIKKSISFQEMDKMSNRISKVIQRFSDCTKPGYKIIAISLKPSEYLPVILLAIMKAGIAYLPIDIEFPEDRIRHILQDSQPIFCIVEENGIYFLFMNTTCNNNFYNVVVMKFNENKCRKLD